MEDYKYNIIYIYIHINITNVTSLWCSILCLMLSPSACSMLELRRVDLLLILVLCRVDLFVCLVGGFNPFERY